MSTAAIHEGPDYLEHLSEYIDEQFQAIADQNMRRVQGAPAGKRIELYVIDGYDTMYGAVEPATLFGKNLNPYKFMVRLSVELPERGFYKDYQLAADSARGRYFLQDVSPTKPDELAAMPGDLPALARTIGELSSRFVALSTPDNVIQLRR